MKVTGFTAIYVLMISLLCISCSKQVDEYVMYDKATGEAITLNEVVDELVNYDVIVVGEYHGTREIHKLQADLLKTLHRKNKSIAISLEMFERDVQDVLDAYLSREIDEQEFLINSRPWSNYDPDYKPVIEFARKKKLPVLASNVPRRYASHVGRYSLEYLKEVPQDERQFFADEVFLTEDRYKEKFFETMLAMPHMTGTSSEEFDLRMRNLYAAQSLKDDTMAESIVTFLEKEPGKTIVHLNGDFHSRERLGVVTKINLRNPELKIAVISPLFVSVDEEFVYDEEFSNIGDFIVVLQIQDNE